MPRTGRHISGLVDPKPQTKANIFVLEVLNGVRYVLTVAKGYEGFDENHVNEALSNLLK